ELLKQFTDAYSKVLDEQLAPVLASVSESRKRVFEVLNTKSYKDEKLNGYIDLFLEIENGAQSCTNVSVLRGYADRAEALKIRLLNEMDKLDQNIALKKAEEIRKALEAQAAKTGNIDKEKIEVEVKKEVKVKKTKNVPIKNMTKTASWRIESREDVDRYIDELRLKLISELDTDTIVNIEF
ncbi:MAG: BREX system P-loop protein BrxC, partial [Lachnospiraceae bacterium]